MTVVRPVRGDELEAMLVLMCRAFGLPIAPARQLFFEDPYFDPAKKRVLERDGRIVSCLTLTASLVRLGAAVVPVTGIAGVATRPEEQRRGYASRLLLDTAAELAASGAGLLALVADSPMFYERLGWRSCGSHARVVIPAASVRKVGGTATTRKAAEDDVPHLARIHAATVGHRDGSTVRDTRRWRYLLRYIQGVEVWPARGEPEGYIVLETRTELGSAVRARVLEVAATTEDARASLWAHAARAARTGDVVWVADPLRFAAELPPGAPENLAVALEARVMYRIADFRAALAALAPNFHRLGGRILLACDDPMLSRRTVCEIARGTGGVIATEVAAGPADVEGDQAVWARVLTGDVSLQEAAQASLVRASPAATSALEESLPRRDPFLPPPDHF